MAPQLWDPYRVLNITARDRGWMHCMGHVDKFDGARCRWKIEWDEFAEVRKILERAEVRPPHKISSQTLSRLIWLSLCSCHRRDIDLDRLTAEWAAELDEATRAYDEVERQRILCADFSTANRDLKAQLASQVKQSEDDKRLAQACLEEAIRLHKEQGLVISQKLDTLTKEAEKMREDHASELAQVYTKASEEARKRFAALETDFRSQLAAAHEVSAQLQTDTECMTLKEAELIEEKQELASRLSSEREETKSTVAYTRRLIEALGSEVAQLKAQQSGERLDRERATRSLHEAQTAEQGALKEMEALRSQVADERQSHHGLRAELRLVRTEVAGMREQLLTERRASARSRVCADEATAERAALAAQMDRLRASLQTERDRAEALGDELRDTRAREGDSRAAFEQRVVEDAGRDAAALRSQLANLQMRSNSGILNNIRNKSRKVMKSVGGGSQLLGTG